jgi:hypothetical protein
MGQDVPYRTKIKKSLLVTGSGEQAQLELHSEEVVASLNGIPATPRTFQIRWHLIRVGANGEWEIQPTFEIAADLY